MANTKTSGLTALAGSALDAADYFPVLDSSATELKKLLASAVSLTDSGKTASFTAAPGYHYRVDMNGAGADFAITFPASPAIGDFFAYTLTRAHATYNLTINRNGNNVYGGTNVDLYTTKEAGHTSYWRWDSTTSGQGWIRMNEPKVNVQTFTADGTWVKPPGAMFCFAVLIGGGGGGGSGRRGTNGGNRFGGGGGGAGQILTQWMSASDLSSTETVTIGAGGAGGAAQTTNATDGNDGTDGGTTAFANIKIAGGLKGSKGTGTSGTAGSTGFSYVNNTPCFDTSFGNAFGSGANGGSQNASSVSVTVCGMFGVCGGGGGGGVNSGNTHGNGGAGGRPNLSTSNFVSAPTAPAGGTAGGNNGTAGSAISGGAGLGLGGGGGGGNSAGVGGTGGAGGSYGGGGGGGGASADGNNSGAGGQGGGGFVRVVTFCR